MLFGKDWRHMMTDDVLTGLVLHFRLNADPFNGHPNPCLAQLGRDLRRIADDFERSQERRNIKNKANQVRYAVHHLRPAD